MIEQARGGRSGYTQLLAFALALLIGGLVSLSLGQDANWDLRNYHIHNAWALLNDRMGGDLLTAGIQSYFNPLLDVPYYKIAIDWFPGHPRLVAFLAGLPAGMLLFFVWLVSNEILRCFDFRRNQIRILSIIVVSMGMTGAATLSQWGTTFNEIQIAVLVVAGVYLIVAAIARSGSGLAWFVAAGVCLGAAAGLKLTAAVYAPGAFLALALTSGGLKPGVVRAIGFSAGWWIGFLVLYGWWGYHLYALTENPVFPMFNALFGSPLIDSGNFTDLRFKPEGFMETLFYPFFWLKPESMVVTEPAFADPRFALAYLAVLTTLLAYVYRQLRILPGSPRPFAGAVMPRPVSALAIWLGVSYVLWQLVFSILRYTIPLEVFTGLVILVCALLIGRWLNFSGGFLPTLACLSGAALLSVAFTQQPQWGRVNFGRQVIKVENVALPDNSLVIFNERPLAYLAPFLSRGNPGVSFVGVVHDLSEQKDYPLWQQVRKRIQGQADNLYMVAHADQALQSNSLSEFGLSVLESSCAHYRTNVAAPFKICELQRGVQ